MCLEFMNQFFGLSFALWGLAIFILILAALAGIAVLSSTTRRPDKHPARSFTCPCYAPPYVPPNSNRN